MKNTTLMGAALLAVGPLTAGCASSQALRASLNERDAEIGDLAAENHELREELARTRNDRDNLRVALEEASARLTAQPEEAAASARTPRALEFDDLTAEGIGAAWRGDAVVFTVPSAVTFASGRADLTSSGRKALKALAGRIQSEFSDDSRIFVEGHTDSDPIRKSGHESNRDLSWARARAVHAFLVEQGRISDERFVVVGHGPHRPLKPNDTEANKARNRRVEVIVRAAE